VGHLGTDDHGDEIALRVAEVALRRRSCRFGLRPARSRRSVRNAVTLADAAAVPGMPWRLRAAHAHCASPKLVYVERAA